MSRSNQRILRYLLFAAMYAYAHWFFGNLYESVVTTPQGIHAPDSLFQETALFAPGSPVRYYLPITVIGTITSLIALAVGWNGGKVVRWRLSLAVLFAVTSQLLTAYIVTQINLSLFFGGATPSTDVIVSTLQHWQFWNLARLFSTSVAFTMTLSAYLHLYELRPGGISSLAEVRQT